MGQFSYNPLNGQLDFSQNGLEAGTLDFMGNIAVASDFPTAALVEENDIYRVTAGVTDNDVTKTNTGQVFVQGDEIMWNGSAWELLGNYVSLLGTNNTWTGTNTFNDIVADKITAGASGNLTMHIDYADGTTATALFQVLADAGTVTVLSMREDGLTSLTHTGTTSNGWGVFSDTITTGVLSRVYSNSADISSRHLHSIINDHASAIGTTALYVRNDSTNAVATFIGSATTNPAVYIQADALTTGAALYVYSNSANSAGRALFSLINDNTSATGTTCIAIQQDANATGLLITGSNTTQTALQINLSSLTTGRGAYIYSNSSSPSQFVLLDLTNTNASATGMIPLAIANLAPTSTNYFRMMYLGGNSGGNYIWKANGVTPNGNLSGSAGDICIGADGGKAYYCGGGTTWTAM